MLISYQILNLLLYQKKIHLVLDAPIEIADLYIVQNDEVLLEAQAGMYLAPKSTTDYYRPDFEVMVPTGKFSIYITEDAVSPHFPIRIFNSQLYEKFKSHKNLILGIVGGVHLSLLLLVIGACIFNRSATSIIFTFFYIFYLLFIGFVYGQTRGLNILLLEGSITNFDLLINRNWIKIWGAFEFFGLNFGLFFYHNSFKRHPILKRIVQCGLISSLIKISISNIFPVEAVLIFSPLYLLGITIFIFASYDNFKEITILSYLSMSAWLVYSTLGGSQLFFYYGFIPVSIFSQYGLIMGLLLQWILLGVAQFTQRFHIEKNLRILKSNEEEKKNKALKQLNTNFEKLKNRDNVIKSFVSPTILSEVSLGLNPSEYAPKNLELSIMFNDMRNYTSFAESEDLDTTFKVLNQYLGSISKAVMEERGEVDKLIGDSVMSKFSDAHSCLQSCLSLRKSISDLNRERLKQGKSSIRFGTGISFGEVLSANYGSYEKLDRTIVGDAVNISSRLEAATKNYKVNILVDHSFISQLKGYENFRPLGYIQLKGKRDKTMIYEIFGDSVKTC